MNAANWLVIATVLSGLALAAATLLAPSLAEIIKAVLGRESGHDFAKGCLVGTGCSILLSLLLSVCAITALVWAWVLWVSQGIEARTFEIIMFVFCVFSISLSLGIVILRGFLLHLLEQRGEGFRVVQQ